jgi:hypothetical protein
MSSREGDTGLILKEEIHLTGYVLVDGRNLSLKIRKYDNFSDVK